MANRPPSYVGAWNIAHFGELVRYYEKLPGSGPYFHMFVERTDGARIFGKIEDVVHGGATFEGERTEERIEFDKKYFPYAIERGGYSGVMHYSGLIKEVEVGSEGIRTSEVVAGIVTFDRPKAPITFLMIR